MTAHPDDAAVAATQTYLDAHFCDAAALADAAGIDEARLERLIAAGMVPGPAYVVSGDALVSAAFGPLKCEGLRPGSYYRTASAAWARRAAGLEPNTFERQLRAELGGALRAAHATICPLPDAFGADGASIEPGLQRRLDTLLDHFRTGVLSICIADLASADGIVRKEILQEKLSRETDRPAGAVRADIAAYAEAAMPFSPLEYPASSRKRLVEDLAALLP